LGFFLRRSLDDEARRIAANIAKGTNGKCMEAGEIEAWCEHAAASEGPPE
jgi:hypothetical protein